MAKQQKVPHIGPRNRDGEGVTITTNRRSIPLPDGTVAVEMGVEMGNAPVPDRRYVADIACIEYRNATVYLVLGQRKLVEKSLRSMIVLTLSSIGVLHFLKACEKLDDNVFKRFNSPELVVAAEALGEEPNQVVELAANIILIAFAGQEACFDFYFVSPYVIAQLAQGGDFAVDPVVRVTLNTGLAHAILDKFQALKRLFPADELKQVSRESSGGQDA